MGPYPYNNTSSVHLRSCMEDVPALNLLDNTKQGTTEFDETHREKWPQIQSCVTGISFKHFLNLQTALSHLPDFQCYFSDSCPTQHAPALSHMLKVQQYLLDMGILVMSRHLTKEQQTVS